MIYFDILLALSKVEYAENVTFKVIFLFYFKIMNLGGLMKETFSLRRLKSQRRVEVQLHLHVFACLNGRNSPTPVKSKQGGFPFSLF